MALDRYSSSESSSRLPCQMRTTVRNVPSYVFLAELYNSLHCIVIRECLCVIRMGVQIKKHIIGTKAQCHNPAVQFRPVHWLRRWVLSSPPPSLHHIHIAFSGKNGLLQFRKNCACGKPRMGLNSHKQCYADCSVPGKSQIIVPMTVSCTVVILSRNNKRLKVHSATSSPLSAGFADVHEKIRAEDVVTLLDHCGKYGSRCRN